MCTLLLCVLSMSADPAVIASQWTLDDATLVSCTSGQCAARPVASAARRTARLCARVATKPIRALRVARPIRRMAGFFREREPVRRALRLGVCRG